MKVKWENMGMVIMQAGGLLLTRRRQRAYAEQRINNTGYTVTQTDYIGNIIYENTSQKMILTPEGYYDCASKRYCYYLKDHLGSVRVVLQDDGTILEKNHYYPSGMRLPESTNNSAALPFRYGGKELESMNGLNQYDFGARRRFTWAPITTTPDPLCEKYYSISPYSWCENNPVNAIDPMGMDVYRYDDKTGDMSLFKKTDDNFDQIGKFKTVTNKETGEKSYELKTNKDGTAKTRMDNVEKGILSDGINFMKNDNVIAVGGKGQASVEGVEAFAVNLSDMVGKEISGAYFSKDGAEATTQISIGSYQNNTLTQSGSSGHALWQRMNPDSQLGNSITGFFHTHLTTGYSVSDRTTSSKQDRDSRDAALKLMPNLQFYILTHPVNYGDKFPYKIPYTNAW